MKTKFKGIKTAAEHQRGELVRDILKLVGAGVAISAAAVAAPNTLQLLEYLDPKNRTQRNKIWNAIHYLERRGDVHIRSDEKGDQYVYLTQKGKMRLSDEAVWELQPTIPRKWDRKWRIVMFDLPTRAGKRHVFRSKLEDLGFHMYQRSVFIYPYECREEVFTVARWMNVHEYVRYIVAEEIHDMRRFAKLFDLL